MTKLSEQVIIRLLESNFRFLSVGWIFFFINAGYDQGLYNKLKTRQQIRRISNSGSKILKISYLTRLLGDSTSNTTTHSPPPGGIHHRSGSTPGAHHPGPRGGSTANLRRGSVDPMSILKGPIFL